MTVKVHTIVGNACCGAAAAAAAGAAACCCRQIGSDNVTHGWQAVGCGTQAVAIAAASVGQFCTGHCVAGPHSVGETASPGIVMQIVGCGGHCVMCGAHVGGQTVFCGGQRVGTWQIVGGTMPPQSVTCGGQCVGVAGHCVGTHFVGTGQIVGPKIPPQSVTLTGHCVGNGCCVGHGPHSVGTTGQVVTPGNVGGCAGPGCGAAAANALTPLASAGPTQIGGSGGHSVWITGHRV